MPKLNKITATRDDRVATTASMVLYPVCGGISGALLGFVAGILPYFGLHTEAWFEAFFFASIGIGSIAGTLLGFLTASQRRSGEAQALMARYRRGAVPDARRASLAADAASYTISTH